MNLHEKFLAFESDMNNVLLERQTEVHLATLAILSKRHMFMLGVPGVGKSMLVDELSRRITDATHFKWLLTRQTVADEIFGPPDLHAIKDQGIYRRRPEGKLADVDFAMLDEIFNANDSILNALLLIINEGQFMNPGDDPNVPLKTLFAASNSLPQTPELEALVDRLVIRTVVKPINEEANFAEMITRIEDPEPTVMLTLEEIVEAQSQVEKIELSDSVTELVLEIRGKLAEENIPVSDRRWRQCMSIVQAEAWLNGNPRTTSGDVKPLVYSLWREPTQIAKIQEIIYAYADPMESEALSVMMEIDRVFADFRRGMDDVENPNRRGKLAVETLNSFKNAKQDMLQLFKQAKENGHEPPASLLELKRKMARMGPEILREGFHFDDDDLASKEADEAEGEGT